MELALREPRPETMTDAEWNRQQGRGAQEGASATMRFPVFEVDSYCLDPDDVERQSKLLDDLGGDVSVDVAQARAWLAAHRCGAGPA